ncbi:hypothetical protein RIR_jg28340.t1 [Rhizophagus irregularis DAOM 181602=DAOM 197198]|nr:hypothetical protein RIR_jg28340.t1 [Rhizophagus irregularis DAOM 181602=DAOM 197198]
MIDKHIIDFGNGTFFYGITDKSTPAQNVTELILGKIQHLNQNILNHKEFHINRHLFSTAERQSITSSDRKGKEKLMMYYHLQEAEIPIQKTNGITKIYKIIIILRNILIVNISLFV